MGSTARSGSHLPEKSDCRIRQFARTAHYTLAISQYVMSMCVKKYQNDYLSYLSI